MVLVAGRAVRCTKAYVTSYDTDAVQVGSCRQRSNVQTWGALQIQDLPSQLRPVVSEWLLLVAQRDRSWICNAPLITQPC